jgi:hypothetical protein
MPVIGVTLTGSVNAHISETLGRQHRFGGLGEQQEAGDRQALSAAVISFPRQRSSDQEPSMMTEAEHGKECEGRP